MLSLLHRLRQDEHGVILSTELVVVGSLLVVGLITGTTCLQRSVDAELRDLGNAIGSLDQSYSFSAHRKIGRSGYCSAWTAGSSYFNCEAQQECCHDITGCHQDVAVGCGSCGNAHCSGCGSAAVCGSCGTTGCTGGCGNAAGSVDWDTSAVPGLRVSEWSGSTIPQLPIADPIGLLPGHSSAAACEEQCPPVAVPVTPPCTDPGDLVIPDHVW
jgi:hypothetical protein